MLGARQGGFYGIVSADITHPNTQFLLLSPHRCLSWQTISTPSQASLGLNHANLGAEGGDAGGEDLPKAPQFVLRAALSTAGGSHRIWGRVCDSSTTPSLCTAPGQAVFKQGSSGKRGKDAGMGWRGREKGTNLHWALQSGMRRMHKQLLCSRRCRHLSPTAPQTPSPESTSEGSSASP